MKRVHLYLLAGILAAIGCGAFAHKYLVLGFPLAPGERTDVWRVEVQLEFKATGGPAKASLFVPGRTGGLIIVDQSFVSPGYGIVTERRPGHGMRADYSIREGRGTHSITARYCSRRTSGTRRAAPLFRSSRPRSSTAPGASPRKA